uniref:Uncharacterized protein n=1 Tax=Coccidioides posadasii RMSCC 3488 TaxID=454284 RepID=A0A0J6F4S7_COCPO|nr:hypothetical protein CPAG_00331 [Coccidioides posadasii RMSCC 3488]
MSNDSLHGYVAKSHLEKNASRSMTEISFMVSFGLDIPRCAHGAHQHLISLFRADLIMTMQEIGLDITTNRATSHRKVLGSLTPSRVNIAEAVSKLLALNGRLPKG